MIFLSWRARELLNAFPAVEWPGWDRGFGDNEPHQPKKLTCWDIGVIPSPLDLFIHELNSGPFLTWLEKLTGIEDLIPDPQLAGGGLHSSGPGGRLVPHTDFHKGKNQRYTAALIYWSISTKTGLRITTAP